MGHLAARHWNIGGNLLRTYCLPSQGRMEAQTFTIADSEFSAVARYRQEGMEVAAARMANDPNMFNGPMVGSAEPVSCWLAKIQVEESINMWRGRYFDYLSTDFYYGQKLLSNEAELSTEFTRFRSIGVSGLVITRDFKMVVVEQLSGNDYLTGNLGPAGSGSLEPSDLIGTDNFTTALLNGVFREIRQEARIDVPSLVHRSAILGFGEWKEKGYKPEIYSVTLVPTFSTELEATPQHDEQEQAFSGTVHGVSLAPVSAWNSADPYSVVPALTGQQLTVSFDMALRLLAESTPSFLAENHS